MLYIDYRISLLVVIIPLTAKQTYYNSRFFIIKLKLVIITSIHFIKLFGYIIHLYKFINYSLKHNYYSWTNIYFCFFIFWTWYLPVDGVRFVLWKFFPICELVVVTITTHVVTRIIFNKNILLKDTFISGTIYQLNVNCRNVLTVLLV